MRITQSMLFRMSLFNLDQQRADLARTQEQAASGLRINRPSDDPLGAGSALRLRANTDAIDQFQRNSGNAASRLAALENALADVGDLLVRARELALQGANGSLDPTSRELIAREIEGLHAAVVDSSNTRFDGAHLFAGFASDAPAFVAAGSFTDAPPAAPVVSYNGDSGEIRVPIDAGVTVRASFDGRRVFLGDADGDGTPDAGREDVFDVLGSLRNALMNDDAAGTATSLARIDASLAQVSVERTAVGSEISRIEIARERLDDQRLQVRDRLSQVEDADLARVVSDLVRQETALEAGLNAMGRLLPPTLMDFLG